MRQPIRLPQKRELYSVEEEVRGIPPTTHICIHGIDFVNLDLTRCTEYAIDKGKLYGLRAYSKSLKRFVSVAIWYQDENQTDKWQIYFSTNVSAKDVIEYYRTRFQIEFCFRDAKTMLVYVIVYQPILESCIIILLLHLPQ